MSQNSRGLPAANLIFDLVAAHNPSISNGNFMLLASTNANNSSAALESSHANVLLKKPGPRTNSSPRPRPQIPHSV
ncbi:hypothetical protein BCON_0110g00280 [Botryotinia convoluta]|uniref:Uncharacterized protein n=1 Tax=Botryotinia convoluta TaxID=54673 RepID=A0A4Z1HYF3_9HELO|nr:hypothetical protein BCON_0110g00280 [Botryotinia convoluta]